MIIGKKKRVQSIALTENIDDIILGSNPSNRDLIEERKLLRNLYQAFKSRDIELENRGFVCYVEKHALLEFLKFANEVYEAQKHEAQGVFVG